MGASWKKGAIGKSHRKSRHTGLVVVITLLLASLSCAVPALNLPQIKSAPSSPAQTQPQPQPTGEIVATAQPTAGSPAGVPSTPAFPVDAQPPVLVEVQPPDGSDLPSPATLMFYFSAEMDPESVQRGAEFQPAVQGQFEWTDPATLRVTLPADLPPETDLSVTFNNNVRSKAGKFLAEPAQLRYHAPAALRAVDRLPKPDSAAVDPSAAIAATFNRPVVPLVGEVTSLPPGFSLEPAAQGRGEWLNTSTYIFYPQPALAGGKSYSVNLNTGLGLAPAQNWNFTTTIPSVVRVEPLADKPIWLDEPLVITFNQPMDASSVQENFMLENPEEARIAGKFSWNTDFTRVMFRPEPVLERDTVYNLTLGQNAHSQGGTPLDRKIEAQYRTVPALNVSGSEPVSGAPVQLYDGYGSLQVQFTAPLAQQDLTELVTFSPPVPGFNVYLPPDGSPVSLSGYMAASTTYTVTFSPGIKDRWGQPLGTLAEVTFTTSAPEPTFRVPMLQAATNVLFTPTTSTTLPARAASVQTVDILSSNLNLPDFFAFGQGRLQDYQPVQRTTWQQALDLTGDTIQPVTVNLTDTGGSLTPGLYYYSITSPQISNPSANWMQPFVLVVSDIHILMKRSMDSIFVWAYDLGQKDNAARIAITLYDREGNAIGNLVTDEQGVGRVALPGGFDPYGPVYAVSGKPGDANFSLAGTPWSQGLSGWEYGLPVDTRSSQVDTYLYTDRPIYRPGQVVNFRGILRIQDNGRYTSLDLAQITVKALGASDIGEPPEIFNEQLPLDDYGTFSGSMTLPENALPGYYTLVVGDPAQASLNFQVAEYRKPEIEMQVSFPSAEVQAGRDVQANIQASYYFGAPAGRLPVNWTLRSEPGYFSLPDGFQTGKQDDRWLLPATLRDAFGGKIIAEGQEQTAADGTLAIAISASTLMDKLDVESNQRLVLEVTAQDESQQPVSARGAITLHPASFYAGVRPDSRTGKAGEAVGFDVQSVDWQRNPSGEHALKAVFQRVVWKQQAAAAGYPTFVPEYTQISSADFKTDATGRARLSFTPDQPGTYQLRVSGEGTVTEVEIWAGGEGSAPWPQLPNQQLKLVADASSYRPGDTARILIPNPFPQGAQALITVERGEVMRWQVLQLVGASASLDLPIKDEDAPNIYLSVTLLNAQAPAGLDFRQGYLELAVSPAAQILNVQVAATPQKAAPGQEVSLTIQASDAQGKPVEGDFSLALVDKSVLALADPNAPGIVEAFYGRQPLGVQTSLPGAIFSGRIPAVAPGGRGGGGGDAPSPMREKFADTAFWNGQIKTNSNGSALVKVTLPDNLTTWVLDARGVTKDTRVGASTAELVTGKALLVRPAVPRFVVAGDHVEFAAVINNNTAAPLRVDVSLTAQGVDLDDPTKTGLQVDIPANDRRRVAWMATVQAVDEVSLLFHARAGALEDSVRPEQGNLPVLKYADPQTFATAGTLSEAVQRSEYVSLPRSFQPQGGELRLELTPSLGAAVIGGLKALDTYPTDFSETALSRLLANQEAYQALQKLGIQAPELKITLDRAIREDLSTLARLQNQDGSWGWASGSQADAYISAYILFGLTRVQAAGVELPAGMLENALSYMSSILAMPGAELEPWQFDRLLFQAFALQQAGYPVNLDAWYAVANQLSPWSNALLAVMINQANPQDGRATEILSRLETTAERSATGARWSGTGAQFRNYATPVFSTAAVVVALAKLDPASPMLIEGVRYLVSTRQTDGGWYSSYDTAWALMALVEALQGTGDLQARYNYSASLNGIQVAGGSVEGTGNLTPVTAIVPLDKLNNQSSNTLQISRGDGSGRLYYRAYLLVNRPARDAPAVERGLGITRRYILAGQDCRKQACPSLTEARLTNPAPVLEARLTLTVPSDLTNVVVEDHIPAGSEILNATLKTSQQQGIPEAQVEPVEQTGPEFDPRQPFAEGWGWWVFHNPQITATRIRWFADNLPAGTYQLTYRLVLLQTGDYQVLPARAYAYYFPEIQGSSAGEVFKILP